MSRTASAEPRHVPAILDAPARGAVAGVADRDARAEESCLHGHLGRERVGALLQPQRLEEVRAHGAEGAVVAEPQAEEEPEAEGEPIVAEPLVQRHAAGRGAAHRAAPRPDDEVGDAGEHRLHEVSGLSRVVGAVGLHEDDGTGARRRGGTGARQTGVAVAPARFTQQRRAGGADELRPAVGGAVVDEERALQQAEAPKLRQEPGQGLGLVEHRHDDAVVWRG